MEGCVICSICNVNMITHIGKKKIYIFCFKCFEKLVECECGGLMYDKYCYSCETDFSKVILDKKKYDALLSEIDTLNAKLTKSYSSTFTIPEIKKKEFAVKIRNKEEIREEIIKRKTLSQEHIRKYMLSNDYYDGFMMFNNLEEALEHFSLYRDMVEKKFKASEYNNYGRKWSGSACCPDGISFKLDMLYNTIINIDNNYIPYKTPRSHSCDIARESGIARMSCYDAIFEHALKLIKDYCYRQRRLGAIIDGDKSDIEEAMSAGYIPAYYRYIDKHATNDEKIKIYHSLLERGENVIWNLAYCYEKINVDTAMEYYDKIMKELNVANDITKNRVFIVNKYVEYDRFTNLRRYNSWQKVRFCCSCSNSFHHCRGKEKTPCNEQCLLNLPIIMDKYPIDALQLLRDVDKDNLTQALQFCKDKKFSKYELRKIKEIAIERDSYDTFIKTIIF